MAIDIYLEVGTKRVFASAIDWIGWTRAGKDEKAAVEVLAAYAGRYAPVTKLAGLKFPASDRDLRAVERVKGNATTDFGAPAIPASSDTKRLTKTEADRLCALLEAAWKTFDAVAAKAPAALRKGPRGGGRDRGEIVEHVLGAEAAYAPRLGLRLRQPDAGDARAIKAFRAAILDGIRAPVSETRWPPRYAARRIAWHALDHAWEIEDRSS